MNNFLRRIERSPEQAMEFINEKPQVRVNQYSMWKTTVQVRLDELISSIKSVWNWFPIMWRDRDWDYDFLLTILRHKLFKMQVEFSQRIAEPESIEKARQLQECVYYLDRFLTDAHCRQELHNFSLMQAADWLKQEVNNEEVYQICMSDEHCKLYNKLLQKKSNLQKDELARLFDIMRKNVLSWWT